MDNLRKTFSSQAEEVSDRHEGVLRVHSRNPALQPRSTSFFMPVEETSREDQITRVSEDVTEKCKPTEVEATEKYVTLKKDFER